MSQQVLSGPTAPLSRMQRGCERRGRALESRHAALEPPELHNLESEITTLPDGGKITTIPRDQRGAQAPRGESDQGISDERCTPDLTPILAQAMEHTTGFRIQAWIWRGDPLGPRIRAKQSVDRAHGSPCRRTRPQLHEHDCAQDSNAPGANHEILPKALVEPVDIDIRVEKGPPHRTRANAKMSTNPPTPLTRRWARRIGSSPRR